MKILQTCGSMSWGGLEMETIKISHALKEMGHEVLLLCPANSSIYNETKKIGVPVKPVFNKTDHFFKTTGLISEILRHIEFDIIHCQLSHDLWTLVPTMVRIRNKSKLVMSKHVASRVKKKDIFHRFLYRRIDKIISISDFIKDNVIETCPVRSNKVKTIYNGIPDEFYTQTSKSENMLRKKYNINDDKLLIGLVGRLTLMKGHREFLQAIKFIIDRGVNNAVFLVIGGASYGEEDYEKSIYQLAEELNLNDHLIFTGFRDDIRQVMSDLDILAFPSHKESFGNTLIEGMSRGLPVVASASGAVPEIVKDGVEGFLVPAKSAEALADKLIMLIKDKKLREEMGSNGRKKVGQKFLFSTFIHTLEKTYQQLQRLA